MNEVDRCTCVRRATCVDPYSSYTTSRVEGREKRGNAFRVHIVTLSRGYFAVGKAFCCRSGP